ncbi:hypothetical protein CBOM_04122 [Ceraceosorus bombacis]|uniref:Uncharacterized protein n=1 Tax=Ceraceosorus bombacis TaxID=401625 RepID=A0A0P1BLS0_9BASI|nr:hypothetical protein CBOM_04122 [Ceraceosorus bombacis]
MAPDPKRRVSGQHPPFTPHHPLLGVGASSSSTGAGSVASRIGDFEQQQRDSVARRLAPLPNGGGRRSSEPAIQRPAASPSLLARKVSAEADGETRIPSTFAARCGTSPVDMTRKNAAVRQLSGPRPLDEPAYDVKHGQPGRTRSIAPDHSRPRCESNEARTAHQRVRDCPPVPQARANRPSQPRPGVERSYTQGSSSTTPGYYLPPPGYSGNDGSFRRFPPDFPISGEDFDQRAGTWKQQPSGAWTWTSILDQGILPSLTHSDWSLPQAKQILSSWATLATLLAGTQTTLLGYYRQSKALDNTVTSLVYAAIVLDVWGALLAVVTIICSITLQSPEASSRINLGAGTDGGLALGPLGLPRFASTYASDDPFPSRASRSALEKVRTPLSSRSLCILDRLTYACGLIIPLGGLCELISLAIFSVNQLKHTTEPHGAPALFIALGLCFALTLISLATGAVAGHRHDRHYERNKQSSGKEDDADRPGSGHASADWRNRRHHHQHHDNRQEAERRYPWNRNGKISSPSAVADEETLHDPFDEEKGLLFNQTGPI